MVWVSVPNHHCDNDLSLACVKQSFIHKKRIAFSNTATLLPSINFSDNFHSPSEQELSSLHDRLNWKKTLYAPCNESSLRSPHARLYLHLSQIFTTRLRGFSSESWPITHSTLFLHSSRQINIKNWHFSLTHIFWRSHFTVDWRAWNSKRAINSVDTTVIGSANHHTDYDTDYYWYVSHHSEANKRNERIHSRHLHGIFHASMLRPSRFLLRYRDKLC